MLIIHPEQMYNLLAGAAIVGAKTATMMMGGCQDLMIQKEAYAKYGNKTIKKWHKEGLLHPKKMKNGSYDSVYYPVIELLIASQSEVVSKLTPNASSETQEYLMEQAMI